MIYLTRIRSMKKLEEIKEELNEFLTSADILPTYLKIGWGEEDYDADKESAQLLLEKTERRIKSLSGSMAKTD
jgi:HEPN domain-containing protein